MAYTPIAYTTQEVVARLLRVANAKIKIGDMDDGSSITSEDVDAYILDASRLIDMTIIKAVNGNIIPVTAYTNYPEIGLSAPRIAAFMIYRDIYGAFRIENMPMGPKGWIDSAMDYLKTFVENLNDGCYPSLSISTGGPGWETAEMFFMTQTGNCVSGMISTVINTAPSGTENIGPYVESDED
jgi:hypothetical protein